MNIASPKPWMVLGLALLVHCLPCAANGDDTESKPSVRLVIAFGDGVEKHFTELAWKKDMTVLDLLRAAQDHPRGIRFQHRGNAETAFVTEIDGLKNEGQGKNWIYQVNGELADRSCGVYQLDKGDTVLWSFGKYR
jgi:hypothetical protein